MRRPATNALFLVICCLWQHVQPTAARPSWIPSENRARGPSWIPSENRARGIKGNEKYRIAGDENYSKDSDGVQEESLTNGDEPNESRPERTINGKYALEEEPGRSFEILNENHRIASDESYNKDSDGAQEDSMTNGGTLSGERNKRLFGFGRNTFGRLRNTYNRLKATSFGKDLIQAGKDRLKNYAGSWFGGADNGVVGEVAKKGQSAEESAEE